jgi:hypothetical protein
MGLKKRKMNPNIPCATPFFYTPAPGVAFDNLGYLSAVEQWRQSQGYEKTGLPMWPPKHSKIYPIKDHTVDYYPVHGFDPRPELVRVSSIQNWPSCVYPLRQ